MTTVNDGHTPTPWYADSSGNIRTADDRNAPCVAVTNDPDHGLSYTAVNAANARFIVEACNSHASSLATIEALRGALEEHVEADKEHVEALQQWMNAQEDLPDTSERYHAIRDNYDAACARKIDACNRAKALLSDQPAKQERQ
jgi:hypothetical protein